MKKEIGVWIDHSKAVIVIVNDNGENVREISSNMEKHVRYSNDTSEGGASEDTRDREFDNHLNTFYDGVVAAIHDGTSFMIFGPGEAKGELRKRLEMKGLKQHIVAVETADKMTDHQIAAKVRERFKE